MARFVAVARAFSWQLIHSEFNSLLPLRCGVQSPSAARWSEVSEVAVHIAGELAWSSGSGVGRPHEIITKGHRLTLADGSEVRRDEFAIAGVGLSFYAWLGLVPTSMRRRSCLWI